MNRVLRRPMFRTGGSAEGITSGLDQTQLTASRPMYNRGRVVRPGGYAGEKEEYARMNKILQNIRGPRESRFPEFLTSMGLDLLTRPKSGNIFQQVAASAKGPYSEWMAAKAASGAEEDKLSAALLGDVMDVQARKELQKAKLESEERIAAMGEKDKTYQFEKKQEALGHLIDTQYKLEDELIEIQNKVVSLDVPPGVGGGATDIPAIKGGGYTQEKKDAEIKNKQREVDKNKSLQDDIQSGDLLEKIGVLVSQEQREMEADELTGEINPDTGKNYTFKEAMARVLEYYAEIIKTGNYKTGGRVGYQNAGSVMPSAMPNAMPSAMPVAMQAPGPTDQGQDDTVQDLSFEELRARLPQEITNDIVKLLSESKQALVDFANIRTQQDVNTFNQKYDVNLVVPQEV
jgi:hypothetical protein